MSGIKTKEARLYAFTLSSQNGFHFSACISSKSAERIGNDDYISLTDMAHSQMQEHIIFKWLSNKNTIEYLGEWESLYNPNFNYTEFQQMLKEL